MPDYLEQIERKRARLAWATAHPRLPEYIAITGGIVDVVAFERWLEDLGYGNDCQYPSEDKK